MSRCQQGWSLLKAVGGGGHLLLASLLLPTATSRHGPCWSSVATWSSSRISVALSSEPVYLIQDTPLESCNYICKTLFFKSGPLWRDVPFGDGSPSPPTTHFSETLHTPASFFLPRSVSQTKPQSP